MEMFLMVLCMSLFGAGIMAAAFGVATQPNQPPQTAEQKQEVPVVLEPAKFFTDYTVSPVITRTEVPIEVLLLQIENHVRLEQAAAETFLFAPSPSLLHNRTVSRFVN